MKSIEILIQSIMKSMGIKIDPAEIELAWGVLKEATPKVIELLKENRAFHLSHSVTLSDIDTRLKVIEAKLECLN